VSHAAGWGIEKSPVACILRFIAPWGGTPLTASSTAVDATVAPDGEQA
jgi:hypothetical protein